MVIVNPAPAALSAADLSLFYTTDELLSNSPVLIFYGPTATSTQATHSRIQAHVFTPAGLHNFARLIISPTASFYSAVTCLPQEDQGDEICRGLAFSLYKYFVELPAEVKDAWDRQYNSMGRLPSAPKLFSESHAAMIAARMTRVENMAEIITDVRHALGEQTISWLDVDVILPEGAVQKLDSPRESAQFDESEDDVLQQRYGQYAAIVKLFGETAFLPTSKLRRAPSKPTALNRSQSFARNQKENLRREMCELLDTEENYVSKLYDLVHSVADDFRNKAKQRHLASTSPTEQALKGLFPPSLDRILEVNSNFLETIRVILEETENDAIQDIENATDDIFVAPLRGQKDPPDVTGALAVAKALVEWFPKFGDCYTDYVGAHAEFSQFLKLFMKDTASSFSKRVHETGEQRLMSMLIEPVQRLPRYNLYIDNIIKQLPIRHPAIKVFLKARDIIAEICSRDAPSAQQIKVFDRLRKMVFSWPPAFNPAGRLITAVDFVELTAPYHGDLQGPGATSGIFLLFTDFMVLLHKPNGCTITARSIMADLDNPKFAESYSGSAELIFHQQLKLSDVLISEHSEGRIAQLLSPTPTASQPGRPRSRDRQNVGIRMFYLLGAYEEKVHKFVEEMTKARVEGRFPESERESYKWEVRSLSNDLNLFSAIFEDSGNQVVEGRKEPAKVQVLVNSENCKPPQAAATGVELTVSISLVEGGFFLLEIAGVNGYTTRDRLTSVEFSPVLTKRLSNFLQLRNNIANPALAEAYLFRNQQLLKSLKVELEGMEDGERLEKGRPHSPVKMLSNLFGGSVGKDGSRKLQRNPPSLGDIPRMAPPLLQPAPSFTRSREELSRPSSSNKNVGFNAGPVDSLAKLEETLATLILAMHSRKGNIVGRSIRARSAADELAVNEVYNSLLENPTNHDTAAQTSVDVLFATFEKFLKIAWREKMGPVMSHATLVSLQMRSESDGLLPGEFEDFFRTTFNEMAPQNQRALRAIIKLLAELLDGTGNDGDRGILTVAFAEMLVPQGNPNDYISLVDRFIQDIEALFPPQSSGLSTPNYGSIDSKSRSTAAGSINSNTSLRKRFGFGTLTRENSKSDESKVGSLWRSLSKNSYADSQPPSLSKASTPASLARSNSTDAANMRVSPKRPSSRDRPTVLGAFPFEGNHSPHAKGFLGALGTIGEVPSSSAGPPRKKRRSSLSDLKTLQSANASPVWSPQTPRPVDSGRDATSVSPRTPSPLKHQQQHSQIPTPTRQGSPVRKENSPANALDRASGLRPKSTSTKPDEVTIKSYSPKKRGESVSAIPMLKPTGSTGGLSERPTSGNTVKVPSTPRSPTKPNASAGSTKKLRMQSPQKLRERLQIQQRDIETASTDLQAELSAIGHELSSRSTTGTPRLTTQSSAPPIIDAMGPLKSARGLETRIATLEKSLKTTLDGLASRTSAIEKDVTSSLQVSESRAKHLDQLYRDMNAENEALYARFNDELEKVERSVRKGKGSEELDRCRREAEEEAKRLRKENARLKREVAGLKAQIRE